jgi:signal transduction histidine kinase/transcriptional regulator with GAF, ATPase, and Fis domain
MPAWRRGCATRPRIVVCWRASTSRRATQPTAMTQEARHELATTDGSDDVSLGDAAESLLPQLRATDDVQPLLGEVLAALAALEDADKALLMRFNGGDTLTIIASAGLAPEHARLLERLPASAHPWADALRAPVAIGDAEIEAAFTPQPLVRAAGVRGLHAVPILSPDGSALGVIATLFRRPLQLSSRQERVAALYARQVSWILTSVHLREQAAQAIDRERERIADAEQRANDTAMQAASAEARVAELQHRTEDLEASTQALERRASLAERSASRLQGLQELTTALSSALTAADVAAIIVDKGVSTLGAWAGSMVLLTSDGKMLERVRAVGYPEEMLARWPHIPLDGPFPLSEAVRERTPVLIGDDRTLSARYPHLTTERATTGTRAVAAVPLIVDGRTLGAIGLSFRSEQDFSSDERAFLLYLAAKSALALERARLYDEALGARREAQKALDELGEERARLDTIVQQMPAGLLIAEAPSGKLVRGNEQLEHILRRQFIASPNIAAYADWQFSSPSGVTLLPEEFPLARSIMHGERVVGESLGVERGDGTRGFVTVSSTPILDRDGRIIAAVATVYDVTDQRRSEESLRFLAEASSILAASLDYEDTLPTIAKLAVPFLADACIIDVVEVDGGVRRVAAVHREASRASAVETALRATPDPTALHHPVVRALRTGMSDLFPEYPPPIRSARPGGVERTSADFPRISGEHLRADSYDFLGDLRPTSLIVVPLFARGRTRGAITLIIENGGRRYGTQELSLAEEFARRAGLAVDNARLYQDAQVANNAKTDFLGVMSHELRTPLNAIIGYTELLLMGVPAPIPDSGRQQIERVRNAAHHLVHLIDEVLAFSRLETGREEVRRGSAQLSAVVTEAASVIAPLAVDRRLELRIDAPSEPVTLETDVGKVRHILLNLLSNAVKFTDGGQIVLTARLENGDVRFDVRDTGVGIAPQHHERIFDPFWQVENQASRRIAGTGIGLSVARRLARLLGGDITVSSRPGEGSTFTARVPRKMGEAPASDAAATGAHES